MKFVAIVFCGLLLGCLLAACSSRTMVTADATATPPGPYTPTLAKGSTMKTAIFAAGCFWGVQERFDKVHGVVSTKAGYTGGHLVNPTYEDICSHATGHAEAVEVTYDPAQVSFAELLDAFWSMHDPTTLDRQGPDVGSNYRSAIFCVDAEQERVAKASVAEVDASKVFGRKIVTQIVPAATFYDAEGYHQHYFDNNGGVCHNGVAVVHTKLAAEAKKERELAVAK